MGAVELGRLFGQILALVIMSIVIMLIVALIEKWIKKKKFSEVPKMNIFLIVFVILAITKFASHLYNENQRKELDEWIRTEYRPNNDKNNTSVLLNANENKDSVQTIIVDKYLHGLMQIGNINMGIN